MTENELPAVLHFEIVTGLDNISQFVGQRTNAGDAKYVSLLAEDYRKLLRFAGNGRVSTIAYDETRKMLSAMFEAHPEALAWWYDAANAVEESKKQKGEGR